ncbi:MAG: hypothetical protein KGJ66_06385 [Alphaproteobacteria bacterium]|nr:hypothetical protein [Alphaproteobacteria bacterium]
MVGCRLRRLARDADGAVAVLFAVLSVAIALAVGAAVDYGRAAEVKATLQSAVDAAALAGASDYTVPSAQSAAEALAQDYVTKSTAALPSDVSIASTAITPGTTGSGNNVAYTMSVSVIASVPTTFLSLYEKSVTVAASATAKNPVVTASFDIGSFVSYACDANTVYWYVVPANGGVPDASAMNLLWSNNTSSPASSVTFNVAASAKIGFAFENVTGARDPSLGGCNYGKNMYGAHAGDTQWLYSSLSSPSQYYNVAPGGTDTGTHANYPADQDCALIVEKGTYNSRRGTWSYSSPPQGQCYSTTGSGEDYYSDNQVSCCTTGATTTTEMTNAAPSCSDLNGTSYQYNWNDMGGTTDTFNYGNDMQFAFSCSGGSGSGNGTSTTSVALTN